MFVSKGGSSRCCFYRCSLISIYFNFMDVVKQTRFLLNYSQGIARFGSVALILIGGYYLSDGVSWFVSLMMSNS
jgi:hypothetical protein